VFLGDPIPNDAYAFAFVEASDIRYTKSEEGVKVLCNCSSTGEFGRGFVNSISGYGTAVEEGESGDDMSEAGSVSMEQV
jgi:hypothetical protein